MKALLLTTAVAALLAAAASPAAAPSAGWGRYLAAPGRCPGDAAAERRALLCLVNVARARAGLAPVAPAGPLLAGAREKVRSILRCGDVSHFPCGVREPATAGAAARYAVRGESIYYGTGAEGGARAAVLAWLESPAHRELLLGPRWQEAGVALVSGVALAGGTSGALWVLQVGARR